MVNPYYPHLDGLPGNQTKALAIIVRNELDLIAVGFDLLPIPSAISGGTANYAVDTGAANAYVVTAGSAIIAYVDGLTLLVKATNANTGASTINVNALGTKAIVRQDGTALQANDIFASAIIQLSYNATAGNFQISNNALSYANAAAASAVASANSAIASSGFATASGVSAAASAQSAADAASYSAALQGTSTTSLLIALGAKVFTTQTNRAWSAGQFLTAASAANNGNYMHGQITSYSGTTLTLNVLDIGGAGTLADWILTIAGTQGPQGPTGTPGSVTQPYAARTSNTQLTATEKGYFIDITSGTFTQTFATPAALGPGWLLRLRNSGTGLITIPASDGVTNWIMYPGEVRDFNSDGTTLRSVVVQPFYGVFTASQNFIKPPGYSGFGGLMWGAGGSGGSGASPSGGGGAGCTPIPLLQAALLSASTAIVVGAAGASVTSAVGNTGGDSTFAGLIAKGGAGGNTNGSLATGGTGNNNNPVGNFSTGLANSGSSFFAGTAGAIGTVLTGSTVYGGQGGAITGGMSNATIFGGAGGINTATGTAPGGGGGGTTTGVASGAGARGEVQIWGVV